MPVVCDVLITAVVLLTFELSVISCHRSSEKGETLTFNQNVGELSGPTDLHSSCERDFCFDSASMTTSLALVPYDENRVMPHEKAVREFTLAGHVFTIKQDWNSLGVAAVVWDSAVVLAEYLIDNKDTVRGKKVLELGAGTGLTGMVAATLGAQVTVTEREEAIMHLRSTIENNSADKSWEISAQVLDWMDPLDDSVVPTVDVIIGADIIYIEETFQHLLRTILSLTRTRDTKVLLSCKIRYNRDLHFLNLLKDYFEVKEILHDKSRDIKIFSVTRVS